MILGKTFLEKVFPNTFREKSVVLLRPMDPQDPWPRNRLLYINSMPNKISKINKQKMEEIKEQRKAIQEVLKTKNKEAADIKMDKKKEEKKPEPVKVEKPEEKVDAIQKVKKEEKKTKPIGPVSTDKKSRKPFKTILIIFLVLIIVIIVFLGVLGLGIYKYKWQNSLTDNIVKYIPYPVILLDYKIISYTDYQEDLAVIEYYLEKSEDEELKEYFSGVNLDKIVLNKLLSNKFLIEKSEELGVVISQVAIDNEFNEIVAQAPGGIEDVKKTLSESFGWTVEQFKEEVLKPYLYNLELQNKISQDDTINIEAKKKTENVYELVKKGEESFEDLAKKYSEDLTATEGGDIGYFGRGEMVEEFEEAAYNLEINEVSGIVKTIYGYHIIKLTEKLEEDDGSFTLRASHILIKTKNTDQWLAEEVAKSKIYVILPGYKWEASCGRIMQKDESCDDENNLSLPTEFDLE